MAALIFASFLYPAGALGAEPQVAFENTPEGDAAAIQNTTGHIDLVWATVSGDAARFELQGSRSPDFAESRTLYRGGDTRSFLSGLAEGAHYFRIRAGAPDGPPGPWSEPLEVRVNYVGETQVQTLMIVGAVCLSATLAIILGGSLRTRRRLEEPS